MSAKGSALWRAVPLCLALSATAAQAQDGEGAAASDAGPEPAASSSWLGSDFSANFSGFVRAETAFSTGGKKNNPFNQQGNLFNGVAVNRSFVLGENVVSDTTTRFGGQDSGQTNLAILRARLEADIKITSKLSLQAKVTAIYDPTIYTEFDPGVYNSQAAGALYGRTNYFRHDVEGETHPNPLEWSGRDFLINLPALFLDYQDGPLNIRIGNQQIAWGQAIFFRVLDVPDGLDFPPPFAARLRVRGILRQARAGAGDPHLVPDQR